MPKVKIDNGAKLKIDDNGYVWLSYNRILILVKKRDSEIIIDNKWNNYVTHIEYFLDESIDTINRKIDQGIYKLEDLRTQCQKQ